MNRLVGASSPYLSRHADDLVDWYPWCDEAFERARKEDKPIFLSVGFAACHLCHLMQRESFADPEIAELMNARFVSIIVDRDERPDLDVLYLDALAALGRGGGWPATLFLLPTGTPFYGGTYFPPKSRRGAPSFRQILAAASDFYTTHRGSAVEQGHRLMEVVTALACLRPEASVDAQIPEDAMRTLAGEFDEMHAGFGGAPKFPPIGVLEFLLRNHRRTGDEEALRIVLKTLDEMARGGIRDHVGGGFHRYALDSGWQIPHFEKLLVDNALLALAYARGWAVSGRTSYRTLAEETLDYLISDLWLPCGAFATGRDAETEGVEGATYLWTLDDLRELLLPCDLAVAVEMYGVTRAGNFYQGANVLRLAREPSDASKHQRIRTQLKRARAARLQPALIESVFTDANGIALAALAEVGRLLKRADYVRRGESLARFLLSSERENRFPHTLGVPDEGLLDDYACLAAGLLELSHATGQLCWLSEARRVVEQALADFGDTERGAFFLVRQDSSSAVAPPIKVFADRPAPSGNALMARTLMTLASVYCEEALERQAEAILAFTPHALVRVSSPVLLGHLLAALEVYLAPRRTVVIAGADPARRRALRSVASSRWAATVAVLDSEGASSSEDLLRIPERQTAPAVAHVCDLTRCSAPLSDPTELAQFLDGEADGVRHKSTPE
jgi:uncharacterized protein YyaL (SSP411 family)